MEDDFAFRQKLRQRKRQQALRKREQEAKRGQEEADEKERRDRAKAAKRAAKRAGRRKKVKLDHDDLKQQHARALRIKERSERQLRSQAATNYAIRTEESRMLKALLYVPVVPPRMSRNMRECERGCGGQKPQLNTFCRRQASPSSTTTASASLSFKTRLSSRRRPSVRGVCARSDHMSRAGGYRRAFARPRLYVSGAWSLWF